MGMKYLAYGSNINSERMRDREIGFLTREHAVLGGWRLKFNKVAFRNPKEGYANIVKDEEGIVEGVLYEIRESDLSNRESDLSKLDGYEGHPKHYKRTKVKVKLDNGREVEAITYIAQKDKIREGLKPTREYLNHLLKGCDILSEEYCEKLKRWETLD